MLRATISMSVYVTLALAIVTTGRLVAQSALAQLGLTETAARNFVLNEIKGPALNRRHPIAIAGTRAFLKLPVSARDAAASGLFAWAKAYVTSPAFTTAYAQHRKNVGADSQTASTIDEDVKKKIDSELAEFARMRKEAASLPPDVAAKMLAAITEMEQNVRSPAAVSAYRQEIESTRANQSRQDADLALKLPADPQTLFARRLREFLEITSEVNFSARTIALTGGADGIEFIDKADRQRHWIWQASAIVGPEATAAARTAAQAWLKEIER